MQQRRMAVLKKVAVNCALAAMSIAVSILAMEVGARFLESSALMAPLQTRPPSHGVSTFERLTLERLYEKYVPEIVGMPR